MLFLLAQLKAFFKPQDVVTDNLVHRLHYRITVLIFFAFSLLVSSKQFFGDPIECIPKDKIPKDLLNTFCWVHTTFSISEYWNGTIGTDVPYPGVGKSLPGNLILIILIKIIIFFFSFVKFLGNNKVYHTYYQWVCFVLFLQGICFYIPRYLWKGYERNLIKNLTMGLGDGITLDSKEREKHINILTDYLHVNMKYHNRLFAVYFITETLNFLNTIVQMYLIDSFLGGEFTSYGWKVIGFSEWGGAVRLDPMVKVSL